MERQTLIETARKLEFPRVEVVGAGLVIPAGEGEWAERTRGLLPGHLAQVAVELERHAAEAERQQRAAAIIVEEPETEPAEYERELAEAERAEAAESFARYEAERPKRVEELLARIAAAVEKSAGTVRR